MAEEYEYGVLDTLRGQVYEHPRIQVWFKNPKADHGDYEYTCEQPAKWTPYNANLQMGAIKVVSDCSQVVPEKVEKKITGGVEPTLMLINMVKDIRMEELRAGKEDRIREMAMEMKRKKKEGQAKPKYCWI